MEMIIDSNAKVIMILDYSGSFAENKDIARDIKNDLILPALQAGKKVILDFDGISGATQSFIHALISDLIRKYESEVFNMMVFKNCSMDVKSVINIVADYMEES
jgi:hypothetical protein